MVTKSNTHSLKVIYGRHLLYMESIVIKQSKKLIKLSFQLLEQLIVCYLRKDSCTAKAFVSCFLIKNKKLKQGQFTWEAKW